MTRAVKINDWLYQSLAPVNRLYFHYQPFSLGISDLLGWEAQMSHCPLCCAFVLSA